MTETIVKEVETTDSIEFQYSSTLHDDQTLKFSITGQCPERSYEDRSVFLEVKTSNTSDNEVFYNAVDFNHWINGEDAIALGQLLIKHGAFALNANMIQHQNIHHYNNLKQFISEGRVKHLLFKLVDKNPANHGPGFYTFMIIPKWNKGKAPKYQKDFQFESVIYWSMLEDDYKKQVKSYGVPVKFENYNRAKDIKAFNKSMKETI